MGEAIAAANLIVGGSLNELRAAAREDTRQAIGDIVAELEAHRCGAVEDRQWSVASQASLGKAKVLGLIVDRSKISVKRLEDT